MSEKRQRLLDVLWRAIRDLERYRDTYTSEQIGSDPDARRLVLHALYEASQACVDLGLHTLVEQGLEAPQTYQEVFTRLEAGSILAPDLARRMRGWAGLRNVLAHMYSGVDMTLIAATLRDELGDLTEYARAMDQPADQ